MNNKITYERDVYKSYMKIPSEDEDSYDEKIICKKRIKGTIPFEKCYISGEKEYWYDISGKQALDSYLKINSLGREVFENLILGICNQLEILEWNLVDVSCLTMVPECIFLNNTGEEIFFVLYPKSKGDTFLELQRLIEYLLTKLNHEDKEVVQLAYEIYEITLNNGYSVADLKEVLLKKRLQKENEEDARIDMEQTLKEQQIGNMLEAKKEKKSIENEIYNQLEEKLHVLYEKVSALLNGKSIDWTKRTKDNKEDIPYVIYPEEEEKTTFEIHPTVCLTATREEPKGILIYEGLGDYQDFEIAQQICVIGKSHRVKLQINRETISQFHARIDFENGIYYIEDMNSTNGTYVNEEILSYKERKELSSGDVIRFADVKYRFL